MNGTIHPATTGRRIPTRSSRAANARSSTGERRGVIVLELIVTLPALLILALAVIEFGLIQHGQKHVASASAFGAKIAAETAGLNTANTAANRAAIETSINTQFDVAGYGNVTGITLRHNVGGGGVDSSGNCPDPVTPALPSNSVRVTVCVEFTELSPDLLGSFGFSLGNRIAVFTTTYPYEL
ncbi:MAG: TadE/TadG family type IV pilus assembly protein [Planctomycetota bacterium]|nr:TadE/TadG family type IV pilus assembly protein [Planctomycetota bacterium]MDA1215065.1 TadE/TadG family type IV pilus assembly protein [Planctomycetota bacterium]